MADGVDDKSERGKWDNISRIAHDATGGTPSLRVKAPEQMLGQHGKMALHSSPQKPDGAIGQFKANQIGKKAALKQVEIWYKGQLEAAEHAVSEAVRVRKAEATNIAERMLMDINAEHFQYLTSLGLRNEAARSHAIIELGEQTSRTLKEIEGKDWPPMLIEQAIQGVLQRNQRFFRKLLEELGES